MTVLHYVEFDVHVDVVQLAVTLVNLVVAFAALVHSKATRKIASRHEVADRIRALS